jgi:hypothetical protein
MRLFVVHKSPIDPPLAPELVGVFSSRVRAEAACVGAGTFDIFEIIPDRAYKSGTLRDVRRIVVASAREFES